MRRMPHSVIAFCRNTLLTLACPAFDGAETSPPGTPAFRTGPRRSTPHRNASRSSSTGGSCEAKADKVERPAPGACLVLDDGATRLAIVVVDSCMMPRELIDAAKELARRERRASRPIGC